MPTTPRTRATTALTLVFTAVLALAAPGGAQTTSDATTTTTRPATVEAPPEIVPGFVILGATVRTPGEDPRTLDASQATAFMQSWLAYSVFENPPNEEPPADLPVSEVAINATYLEDVLPVTVFFATRGTAEESWVGMPPQSLGFGGVDTEKWIHAPVRTLAGFRGELEPINTDPTASPTTTANGDAAGSGGDDDDFPWLLAVGIGVLALVALGGGVLLAARRRAAAHSGAATR